MKSRTVEKIIKETAPPYVIKFHHLKSHRHLNNKIAIVKYIIF
jgi:hypothetical protein